MACFSLFQLILSHRTLLNYLKPSEIHYAVYQPNTLYLFALISCFCVQKKISTMTADEYFEKHPELKKFDDEIRNDYWGY
jgi:hypothetical protein